MRSHGGIAVLALLIMMWGCAGAGAAGDARSQSRTTITLEEIEGGRYANAYDMVQGLRPEWLRPRGALSIGEAARGTGAGAQLNVQPGQEQLLVYLEQARLGGPESLRQIDPRNLSSATFLDQSAATYRFGPGHLHGVILLTSR